MPDTPWWPFSLSDRLRTAFTDFKNAMTDASEKLDKNKNDLVISQLAEMMACYIPDIIERDGLPYLCHVINGWGNAVYRQSEVIKELMPFVHRNELNAPFIFQCQPEGDFHPWQTFAYAIMAGVDPDQLIDATGITLRELAKHSRYLNIKEEQGHELGHLLYALSVLEPDKHAKPFIIGDQSYDLEAVLKMAIHAHKYGSFEVCRKVHLAEGICAISANVKGFEHYRPIAENFLNGQLDILLLLCITMREATLALEQNLVPGEQSLLKELRSELKIAGFLENHAFYIGHLVELAGLAIKCGFEISRIHRNAIIFAVNHLNEIIPAYLPYVSFTDCFLHFGHYRRGITMLKHLDLSKEGIPPEMIDLSEYTVNFDETVPMKIAPQLINELSATQQGVFKLAKPVNEERKRFNQVLSHYERNARKHFEPRGKFKHFRRIGPPTWPRSFHYEFLDYGNQIGVEIHLESRAVKPLYETVQKVTTRVTSLFPEQSVQWDPNWYHNSGRLRVLFDDNLPEPLLARAMEDLINETYPEFDPVASNLRVVQ